MATSPDSAPVLSKRGGARIGRSFWLALNVSYPFARLHVYPDRVELQTIVGAIILPRAVVTAVRRERGIFSTGVRFQHEALRVPRFVLFWTRSSREILETLARFGFPVAEHS